MTVLSRSHRRIFEYKVERVDGFFGFVIIYFEGREFSDGGQFRWVVPSQQMIEVKEGETMTEAGISAQVKALAIASAMMAEATAALSGESALKVDAGERRAEAYALGKGSNVLDARIFALRYATVVAQSLSAGSDPITVEQAAILVGL